eukprot:SAG22_NODE_6760_length_814_cov_2.258741_2_plen_159_part_00
MLNVELPEFAVLGDYCPIECCGECCPPPPPPPLPEAGTGEEDAMSVHGDEYGGESGGAERERSRRRRRRLVAAAAEAEEELPMGLAVWMSRPAGLWLLGVVAALLPRGSALLADDQEPAGGRYEGGGGGGGGGAVQTHRGEARPLLGGGATANNAKYP